MSSIIFYILKLSAALAVVYIFYLLVLRRLTFYNWNRWYLLGYTILAFPIPFINITPVLESNEWSDIRIINWVPAITENDSLQNIHDNSAINFSIWNIMILLFVSGMLFLLARLVIQFISFYRMKKKAKPFSVNGLTIYQVNENIIPFSFGSSIFINHQLHSEEELREIIRHEFIHVKQNHSIDIIWGELLCLINWYNPFAWLLKKAIRQNLEFIADNKVVQNGIDKKEYQYLLLKVIGNNQYSIATKFNFSSLKKRIAMMNKTKSAKRQLLRMLFLLPATAILLLAFRNKLNETSSTSSKNESTYNNLQVSNTAIKEQQIISDTLPGNNPPKDFGEFLKRNPQIESLRWTGGPFSVTVNLKNGSKETYNLENKDDVARVEGKYGKLPEKYGKLPVGPPLVPGNAKEVKVTEKNLAETEELAEVKEVTVTEVPVKVVNAELAQVTVIGAPLKKAVSVNGEIKEVTVVGKPLTKTIVANSDLQEVVVAGAPTKRAVSTTGEIKEVTVVGKPVKTIATDPELANEVYSETEINEGNGNGVGNGNGYGIGIAEEEILVTITNKTTREELESFKKKLKDRGFEFSFDVIDYEDGILKKISGSLKSKDTHASFSEKNFHKLVISLVKKGEKKSFKINSIVHKKSLS